MAPGEEHTPHSIPGGESSIGAGAAGEGKGGEGGEEEERRRRRRRRGGGCLGNCMHVWDINFQVKLTHSFPQ
jgi:hypothetical protein